MKKHNLAYFDKLELNKSDGKTTILNKLKSFYKSYTKVDLKFEDFDIYYDKDQIDKLIAEYNKLNHISIFDDIKRHLNNFMLNEIYNTVIIERESSSRKAIKDIISNKDLANYNDKYKLETNLFNAYRFIFSNKKINKENLNIVYSLLVSDIEIKKEKLDSRYYRLDHVKINNFRGLSPNLIDKSMQSLFDFINNDQDENYIFKALLIHFYFEMIHPYYDFNGRSGRILLLWYSLKIKKFDKLLYFSTAIGHYRDQYIKAFNESRKLKCIDATYAIATMLNILISNKKNYYKMQFINNYCLNNFNKELSYIAKNIYMIALSHFDKNNINSDSWLKKSFIDMHFQEYAPSVIYNELNKLKKWGLIKVSDSRPLKIKFLLDKK